MNDEQASATAMDATENDTVKPTLNRLNTVPSPTFVGAWRLP